MPIILALLFLFTAALYASVGFGGGSTYAALLVLSNTNYTILPSLALICNIIVVTGGTWWFWRGGHIRFVRLLPFLVASVPAAYIGGTVRVPEIVFIFLLGAVLLVSGVRLLFERQFNVKGDSSKKTPTLMAVSTGASVGLLSGIVGIGGGIFLAPILYYWRWGTAKEIAGAASFFILVNSLSGLFGQLTKLSQNSILPNVLDYWILFLAVLVGGQIGSMLGSIGIPAIITRRLTALLIIFVGLRLLYSFIERLLI